MLKKALFLCFLAVLVFFLAQFLQVTFKKPLLISPLATNGKISLNLWFPQNLVLKDIGKEPEISAKAAYFIELNTGQVLYQKNAQEKLPIASLVKIMTVIVTLENKKMDDEVRISAKAANMEPDHMELIAGEKLTVKELLYGIFLVSANDAAEALSETTVKNRDEFISLMNTKALQLGMKDTVFINPSGLEEDGKQQYSSAFDVTLMSRYLIKQFPSVVEISSTPHIILPQTATHQDYDMYSGINLLTTYPGVRGLKTGFTPEAGLTLVTLAQKNGNLILGVLLNSENRREEARTLLDYSFRKIAE